jgi:hypothetical protein
MIPFEVQLDFLVGCDLEKSAQRRSEKSANEN